MMRWMAPWTLVAALVVVTGCLGVESEEVIPAPVAPPPASAIDSASDPDEHPSAADTARPAANGYTGSKFDPVAVNGPVFADWPQPEWVLVLTGEQMGYIEPCGCAGLENQKGGVARRATLLNELRQRGWPIVAADLGGQVRRLGRQAEIKLEKSVEALRQMDYQAIGLGPAELRLEPGLLAAVAAEADGGASRFVSANVGLFDLESGFTSRYRVLEVAGRRIGVTSVLGDRQRGEVQNDQLVLLPADEALAGVVAELKQQNCDVLVLLAQATRDEARALAARHPEFDVVAIAGADEPPLELAHADQAGRVALVETGRKGMYAIALGWFDGQPAPRYQRVPLDARFTDAPAMREIMAVYQDQLRSEGLAGLGVRAMPHPRATVAGDASGRFVGSQVCGDCHSSAYEVWKNTPHSHAMETLVNLSPTRQFDPECISCHATGWNPQEYYPYESGYLGFDLTSHLRGNGCENCHGPGGAHVAAESDGADAALLGQLRAAMRLTKAQAEEFDCKRCHDLDNSPEFDFETYWPQVEHVGKD